jgi:uncharacterized membrane protein
MSLVSSFRVSLCALGLLALTLPGAGSAQTLHQDLKETVPAVVLEVVSETEREVIGTDTVTMVQELRIELKGGERDGEVVEVINEVVPLKEGDKIFVNRTVTISGDEYVTYQDFERRPALAGIIVLFVGLFLFLSRWQGVRALLALAGSVLAILFILVPALLAGYEPMLVTVVISAVILAVVLFGTHGFNPQSWIAFGGTISAVIVTGIIAYISVDVMRFTGFSNDAAVYLNFATGGQLDLSGLLLGSIIIGILGVLDDVAVTQASVVQQLKLANPAFRLKELYDRAIVVGRDHLGSLVNTLALAYAGVSLPIILLYAHTSSNFLISINQEVIAVELVRIIVGSIGLILTVPVTTFVAAWYFQSRTVAESDLGSHGHHHH